MYINLDKVSKIKAFVEKTQEKSCKCLIISGVYVVDAKSLLGIFSLDLSKPVFFQIEDNNYEGFEEFLA